MIERSARILVVAWLAATLPAGAQSAGSATPVRGVPATPAAPIVLAPGARIVSGTLGGQEPLIIMQDGGAPVAAPDAGTAPVDASAADAEAAQKKAMRLQKIQQANFDRKPSAILKLWATPPEEAAAASDPAGGEAAPVTGVAAEPEEAVAFEDIAVDDVELVTPEPVVAEPAPTEGAAPAEPGPEAAPEPDPFDQGLKGFTRNVTLGEWPAARTFLGGLEEDEGKALYRRLLLVLRTPPGRQVGQPVDFFPNPAQPGPEANVFGLEDVVGLAAACPHELDDEAIADLGVILRFALIGGNVVEGFVELARAELAKPEGERALERREVARILVEAQQAIEAGEFLPNLETARTEADEQGLNLLARHHLARYAKEKETADLEGAWRATQAVFESSEIDAKQKEEALVRAVELAPKVREELGEGWLDESFESRAERGKDILATIGSATAGGLMKYPTDPDLRQKALALQQAAVGALLAAAPERAGEWRATLNLLAANWMREAIYSYHNDESKSLGPMMQRDAFGNIYYRNWYNPGGNRNQPQAIPTGDVLECRPEEDWLAHVDAGARPRFAMLFAQLYLKVGEEEHAFPHIEALASTHAEQAEDLVDEFLRVWTENHDPNADRGRTNMYMFMYGFEQRAEGIPLTRSKQERNLTELAGWVERLRALPLAEPDEALLARAFTACHSTAEVYRLDAIETVFGPLAELEPKTLAELVQQMRGNLAGIWREPAEQQDKKTNRKQKDIEAEVKRGYEVAHGVVDDALRAHPDDWSLLLARAAIAHDESDYRREIAPDSEFAARREQAFADFEQAARAYARIAPELELEDETTRAYELWFYASLGAVDLRNLRPEKPADLRQPAMIRAALLALPGEAAERHMGMFASALFTRMSSVAPAAKYRYLRSGFEIAGEHEAAQEARKVFEYYNDLVTEIELQAVVDGSTDVGHGAPFGVFVNLVHTREIERESGGFGRYLQNQNSTRYFSYNYGRPTEDYRDKFEEAARQALSEHFEVQSVTFQSEDVNSRALERYGWRVTPYAYLLLKPRGPEVDTLPSLRLDLDFLDTSGYAILPIESPPVPISASAPEGAPRPVEKLALAQILDERQAGEGQLVLEIKASGRGLVPALEQLVDLHGPDSPTSTGFEVAEVEDGGLSVSRFDPESPEIAVTSERNFLVHLRAREGSEPPRLFHFAKPKVEGVELAYQRYVDADLRTVEAAIDLEERYGEADRTWLVALALGLVVAVTGLVWWRRHEHRPAAAAADLKVPSEVTPFTVLGLLRRIRTENHLDPGVEAELAASIEKIETSYFKNGTDASIDLRAVAEDWVARASGARA
jgi:hypothetical protein